MDDLISRSKLKEDLLNRSFYPSIVKNALEKVPAVDAVEVVRCKDCNVPHNKWLGCPNLNGLVPPPDFFCARGERREENAAD